MATASGLSSEFIAEEVKADAQAAYAAREEALGSETMRELERRVILSVLDRKWREHLYEMDYLQEGIGLRAMAQRDPLVEYQREGYELFVAMMEGIKEESVGYLFNVEVTVEQDAADAEARPAGAAPTGAAQAPALPDRPGRRARARLGGPAEAGRQGSRCQPAAHPGVLRAQRGLRRRGRAARRARGRGDVVVDPNASRAERRRAQRDARKRS